jgi:hypothetical protein
VKNIPVSSMLISLSGGVLLLASACTPAADVAPMPTYRPPTYAEITPGPHKVVPDLSTTIDVPPFAYATPLPPPVPSSLDGLYSKMVPLEDTPVPCKRCAGYRLEGGVWTLYLDKGVFKVFHQATDFEAVGSFTVTGNRITFFNDPYCEEDLHMAGTYTWTIDARGALQLQVVGDDPCSVGQRVKNLTSDVWTKTPIDQSARAAACQPPNREAGVSDHWQKPPYCG